MYSRATTARAIAHRRLFSAATTNNLRRCISVTRASLGTVHAGYHPNRLPTRSQSRIPEFRQQRHYASSSGVEEDPERKGLYYHPIGENVFALSFLDDKPPKQDSATVIGFVKGGEQSSSFQENQPFVDLLHDTVKAALIEGVDQELGNDAVQRKEGWLHVHDYRNFPEMGRVGDPEDILGSVLVQDGKIKGETYERMPAYRTCTTDGPTKLSPSLHERLLKSLKEARQKETST